MASKLFALLALGLGLAPFQALAAISLSPDPSTTLAGLWSLSLGGDFGSYGSQDLQSFYPAGSLNGPDRSTTPGYYLEGRKHISDSFFALADLSSLPKTYTVDQPNSQDVYDWDALMMGLGAGWMLYHRPKLGLFIQAEAGWLLLTEGSFQRSTNAGSSLTPTKGSLEGSSFAAQFSGGGQWFLLPSVAIELCGGYRFARLPLSFSTDAGNVNPTFTPQFYADFSAPYGRAGISFFWGLRNPWGQSEAPPPPHEGPPVNGQTPQ